MKMDIRNFFKNSVVSSSKVRVNDDIQSKVRVNDEKHIQLRTMLRKLLELTMRQVIVLLQWQLLKRERYAT